MIVHAEDPGLVTDAHGRRYTDFLASPAEGRRGHRDRRPAGVGGSDRGAGARAAPVLRRCAAHDRRSQGGRRPHHRETCPHYLALTAEEVPDGDTRFKCCPPVREQGNRDALWDGLADGVIDCVVSDHSPSHHRPEAPGQRGLREAWGGIASLQLGLPVVWTQARERGHGLADGGPLDGCKHRRARRAGRHGRRYRVRRRGRRYRAGGRAGSPPERPPIWWCSPRTPSSPWTPGGCTTATRSTRTPGAPSPGWFAPPGCAANLCGTTTRTPSRAPAADRRAH